MFATAPGHLSTALTLGLAFAVGHCVVIAVAGAFAAKAQRWADAAAATGVPRKLRRVCAVLMIVGAGWFAWNAT